MKLVLDPSVALKWCLPEADVAVALQLRDAALRGDYEFIAPDLFPIEVAHALSKAHRQRKITTDEAEAYFDDVLSTAPRLVASGPLASRAYELALSAYASFYDCLYRALAEAEDCRVLTADRRLLQNRLVSKRVVHLALL